MSDIGRQAITPYGLTSHISSVGYECMGGVLQAGGNNPFTGVVSMTANRGYFYPFVLNETVTVSGFAWVNPASVAGNMDAGIYDYLGNRICSAGATAAAGVSVAQFVSITPVVVEPGWYFIAVSASSTPSITQVNATNLWLATALSGMKTVASGCNPLPSSVTLADPVVTNPAFWVVAFIIPTF